MAKKIVLGETCYTRHGKEFIPVAVERGRVKSNKGNIWADQNSRESRTYIDKDGNRLKRENVFTDKFGDLKVGSIVSHEDYTCENFRVTHIDRETGIVTTKGGKNGTWINHINLIIRNPKQKQIA